MAHLKCFVTSLRILILLLFVGAWVSPAAHGQSWSPPLTPSGAGPLGGNPSQGTAYDLASDTLIAFGGYNPTVSPCCGETNDVWILQNASGAGGTPTWNHLTPSAPNGFPQPRQAHSAVYDSATNRLIIFGGGRVSGGAFGVLLNDVWVLTNANQPGNTGQWMPLTPTGGPPAGREGHTAFYNQATNEMYVYGGGNNGIMSVPGDLWVLENANGIGSSAWLQLSETGTLPGPLQNFASAYDPISNLFTVVGGCCEPSYTNATRVLAINRPMLTAQWTNISPGGTAPPPGDGLIYGYNPTSNRLIVHGMQPGGGSNATWLLSDANGVGSTSTWTNRIPAGAPGSPPAGPILVGSAYYAAANKLIDALNTSAQGNLVPAVWVLSDADGTGTATCRVQPSKTYGQYQASPLTNRYQAWTQYPPPPPPPQSPVPQHFGFLPNPNYIPSGQAEPYVVCPTIVSGCALTSAATMLTSFGGLASLDPTQLDSKLKQNMLYADSANISLCPLNLPSCTTSHPDQRISYPDWCEFPWQGLQFAYPSVLALDNAGQTTNSELYDANQHANVPVNVYLSDYVCTNKDRVILQLDETISTPTGNVLDAGTHFVFVTGQSGADWTLFDPGWSSGTPPANLSSLQGHYTGFKTSDGNLRTFSVTGARAYRDISSTGNQGAFSVTANSPIELLVSDPQNRLLGNANGIDVFGIPGGSYFREYPLADDTNDGTANGDPTGIKTAYVEAPLGGTYQVTTTGTGLGTYMLTFRTLATDGSFQTGTVVGVSNASSISTYRIGYSPSPGASGPVALAATFGTTLADISNSFALGLIDNGGIANALSSKVNAASAAAAGGDKITARNILNAFINQLNAQAGKHINGIAPQVLQSDAQSLLSQL